MILCSFCVPRCLPNCRQCDLGRVSVLLIAMAGRGGQDRAAHEPQAARQAQGALHRIRCTDFTVPNTDDVTFLFHPFTQMVLLTLTHSFQTRMHRRISKFFTQFRKADNFEQLRENFANSTTRHVIQIKVLG